MKEGMCEKRRAKGWKYVNEKMLRILTTKETKAVKSKLGLKE